MLRKVVDFLKRGMDKVKNVYDTAAAVVGALSISYVARPMTVFASSYTAPLDNLKTILITIAGSAGIILAVYGAIRFAIAFQKMDQNGEHSAIYTIIAGGVLIGISAVLGAMGV